MNVKNVYSSPTNEAASVNAYLHEDGATGILLSPVTVGPRLTLNLHFSVAEARLVASMLCAAADAADKGAASAGAIAGTVR